MFDIKNKLIIAILVLSLQSCASFYDPSKSVDCSLIDYELNFRYSLFDKLSENEIQRRHIIDVPSISALDELSVFSAIIRAVKNSKKNEKIIPVDLRHYKKVFFGNIIIGNISSQIGLRIALQTSKYSQGFFPMINFGDDFISIFPHPAHNFFQKQRILRDDLQNVEIVINISDSESAGGNMKFTHKQQISIIANRIKKPYALDLRENSNLQFHLNRKWIMPVYSVEESYLKLGKDTAGFFKFVNNKNSRGIAVSKFNKSKVVCYKNDNGPKF
ncbi:MAG: hypothetical protein ACJAW3_001121 [Lentimonas sp.]